MTEATASLLAPLLRLLFPARGRHRRGAGPRHRAVLAPGREAARRPAPPPLRGEDNALVRPYLLAHERKEEARRQRARRRALWLAVHGIDVGPRVIHGVEVTA
ncbi:hypothetical protein JTP67_19310 [Streptomyces sp. S12]|nr:hypothetical protein [Streptomyces sp. S12]